MHPTDWIERQTVARRRWADGTDLYRCRNILEAKRSEGTKRDTVEVSADARHGCCAKDFVSTGAGGQPRREIERRAEVMAIALDDQAVCDPDANAGESGLFVYGRAYTDGAHHGGSGVIRHDEQLISNLFHDTCAVGERAFGNLTVARHRHRRLVAAMGLGERGVTREVRNDEDDVRHYFVAPPCIILPCFIMTSPIAFIISPRIWSMCAIIFGSIF